MCDCIFHPSVKNIIQVLSGKGGGGKSQHCFTLLLAFSNTAFSKIFFKRECILNEQTISGTRSAKSETVYIKVLRFTLADGSREVMLVPWRSSENLKTYSILCKSVLKVKTNNRKLKKKTGEWGLPFYSLRFDLSDWWAAKSQEKR